MNRCVEEPNIPYGEDLSQDEADRLLRLEKTRTTEELYIYPPRIISHNPTLQNFTDLLTSLNASVVPFTRYVFNSIFTTVVTVVLSIVVCSMGAYGLTKHKPAGADAIFAVVLAALMLVACRIWSTSI